MKCVSVLGPTAKTWPQKFALTGCVYIFNCLILIQQLMSWPSEHDQKRTTNKKGANDCKYEAAEKKKKTVTRIRRCAASKCQRVTPVHGLSETICPFAVGNFVAKLLASKK